MRFGVPWRETNGNARLGCSRREATERIETLTEREREVFGHVIRGRLNDRRLPMNSESRSARSMSRGNITTKLGVPSVAELTQLAHVAGLL